MKFPSLLTISLILAGIFLIHWLGLFKNTQDPAPEDPKTSETANEALEITIQNKGNKQLSPNPDKAGQQILVYNKGVELRHRLQGLVILCDQLEVFPKAADEVENAAPDELAEDAANEAQAEKIIATGNVFILKEDSQGDETSFKGDRAVYDPETGEIVLSETPQLQNSKLLIRAKDNQGKILIHKSGLFEASGGNFQTVIIE